jgi:hypothetical protein
MFLKYNREYWGSTVVCEALADAQRDQKSKRYEALIKKTDLHDDE